EHAGVTGVHIHHLPGVRIDVVAGSGPGTVVGAGPEPGRDQVDRGQRTRAVRINLTVLEVRLDDRAGRTALEEARLKTDRAVIALVLLKGRFLLELLVVAQRGDADREL